MVGPEFAELLDAAQQGDVAAFARLWRDTQPALVRYLTTLAPAYAEDVASETWLSVIKALPRFRGDEQRFRAWLFTIARRKLVDATRRDRPARNVPLDELGSAEPVGPDALAGAEEAIGTRAALALVGTLPRDQAEVLLLRVVGGLDTDAVAKVLGKSQGAVRVLAHRGLTRLARLLEERGVTDREAVAFRERDA